VLFRSGVRNAYGSFVPSVTTNASMGYTGSGQSDIGGGLVRSTSAYLTSSYSLMLSWQLDVRYAEVDRTRPPPMSLCPEPV